MAFALAAARVLFLIFTEGTLGTPLKSFGPIIIHR
jgi:hypothetical protein